MIHVKPIKRISLDHSLKRIVKKAEEEGFSFSAREKVCIHEERGPAGDLEYTREASLFDRKDKSAIVYHDWGHCMYVLVTYEQIEELDHKEACGTIKRTG